MKYILYIVLLLFIGVSAKAQLPSSTFPSRIFNGNTKASWILLDSPLVNPILDTFYARYAGTQIVRIQGGDTAFWFYAGNRIWKRLGNFDSTSLSNRINLKLNISDTVNQWLKQTTRLVDTMYRVNDSTVGYTIKGNAYTFQILGGSSSGTSGLTSVGLSMPSAFSVSGSPLTSNGTINVSGAGLSTEYIKGNGTLGTTDTGMIPNFYLKVRSLLSGTSPISYNSTTGVISIPNADITGTKGAATFNSAYFTTNGSGLIGLTLPVSAGSCTGCTLNIGADGRITSYANGAGGATNNVNIGSGFRPVNAITQEMRTYFAGFGQRLDSVSNANGLTWNADTTRSIGLPTYYYTDSLFGSFNVLTNSGISKSGDTVQLGATSNSGSPLNHNTWINTAGFKLTVEGTRSSGAALEVINTGTGSALYGASVKEYGIQAHSDSLYGVYGTSTTDNAVRGWTTNGNTAAFFEATAASISTVTPTLQLKRTTSGTAAAGIGSSIEWYIEKDNGANNTQSHTLRSILTTATSGAEVGQFEIYGVNNAVLARKVAINGAGQWIWDGYPALSAQTDTTTYKPVGIDGSGNVVKMAGWPGSGGGSFTAGNGIDITTGVVSQLFMPLKSNSIILGNSFAMGCCPDGTYTPYQDTLSTAFLNGPAFNNLSVSGMGVRKGAYQLYTNFGEDHANMPILFEVGFNNTRILTDTAVHNATIQAAYRSMIASQFLIHIEGPNWGASGTNPNVTYSTAAAPASSEDTLLNWQSRLYWFRHNSINTGANWFNKASCNNDTITIASMIGSNLAFGTFGYSNTAGSRIKINVDGSDIVTYDPSNRTYTGQAEGFTPDGIIPDAIIITGLTNVSHLVKVIFIDNGKRGALDWFGTMCSAQESYDRPAYILAFPHMNSTGYNYPGGETNQGILDSATTGLKNMLQQTFSGYGIAFVDINASGFYDPTDASQIDADGIHPTNEGHYNIAKAIYTKMLKTDKRGNVSTLDEVLAAGNTSARQILLTAQNSGLPGIEIGNDLFGQTVANSNSWFASNIYFDQTNFRYKHNGVGAQLYFNSGYIEEKTAASGSAGGVATINTRKVVTPTGDVYLGGDITNSITGAGAKFLLNGSTGNVLFPNVAQITPVAGLGSSTTWTPIMIYASGGQPAIAWYNSTGGSNSKVWDLTANSTTFNGRMAPDDYSTAVDWLTVTRSGYTNAQVLFPNGEVNIGSATDQGAYTLQNTGGLYQNGVIHIQPLTAPPSTYNVLVHGLTDSIVYQVPASSFGGITTLNTLTAATQTFATGTSGTDFAISSSSSTHTFNIPSASTSNRGLVTTTSQTFGGGKTFNDGAIITFPSGGSGTSLVVSGDRSLAAAPGVSGIGMQLASFTYTNSSGAGTETGTQNFHLVNTPTLTSGNAISYTGDVSTIRFVGAPIAAGSTTISHPWNIFANDVNYFQTLAMGVNEQAGDATLGNGSIQIYIGSGGNTFTLPSLATHLGKTYFIKNAGSGNLTVARAGSDNIYDTSSVTSITVAAGGAIIISAGTSFWYVQKTE